MSFGDEVMSNQSHSAGNIPNVVVALNCLPSKERKEILAYLDDIPQGVQWQAIAKALAKRAGAHGYKGRLSGQQVRRFVEGSRHGLEP